ncbi:MAG: Elongation factor Ts [Candidatus Anoxychlamydiales bacterium]|nr:Elongation factor Ts [Candidatus Anoxychlamydiales bacterium]NGX40715.1 Elongation factor Ts [Candidatus Anoxychlamydiales bacterium]
MTNIAAQSVKQLRDRSGVGMGKCKDALVEADGDIEKAAEILRKKGLASAVKKEGRETKEGTIAFFEADKDISLLEVNAETDFVAKNERFQKFTKDLAEQIAKTKPASVEGFLKESYDIDTSLTIDEYRNLLIQSIGENIQIPRLEIIHKKNESSYGIYSHMGGKIVTIVEISGSTNEEKFARDLAMHVAAAAPEYLKTDDIPEAVKRKEEEIARVQIKGKPENIVEIILIGKIKAFAEGVCLLNQKYVKDPSLSVEKVVQNRSKEINANLKLTCFWRWKVGETI